MILAHNKMNKFTAKIEIIVGNPYVHVPPAVLKAIFKNFGKEKGQIPIRGKLNGAEFKQTLVRYMGDWRLYLNGVMLKNAGVDFKTGEIRFVVGKEVNVEVEFDSVSRKLPMHPKLKKALSKDKIAYDAYNELSPSRKHEILRYLGFMKSEESTDRNIIRIIKHLRNEETDALYPLMHRKKKSMI
jgi:hypothetical protein